MPDKDVEGRWCGKKQRQSISILTLNMPWTTTDDNIRVSVSWNNRAHVPPGRDGFATGR